MASVKVATYSGSTATVDEAALEELSMVFRGAVLHPGEEGYEEARVIFNGMFERRPAMIVRCSGTADVIDAVKFARAHDLLVAVRGGGHSVAGNSICEGGLMIDLSQMNGVHVDRKARTVRAQGGATWGAVDREAQAFGLATPGGVVSTTGVAGLTLNGGIGWLRNKYGLSCDNLISAEVVTADGELLTASATEHKDLLWALRGGGGNFGIVTSLEFQAHPLGPVVMAAVPMYPLESGPKILRRWRDWVATSPDEVTSAALLWTLPVHPNMPEAAQGQPVLITAGVYAGSPEEGERVLQPLREFGEPLGEIAGAMPFRMVQSAFDPFFPATGEILSYWKSLYVSDLSDEVIDIICEQGANRSSPMTLINIPYLGGAVRRVRPDETAFAVRDAAFMISIDGNWRDPSEGQTHIAWVREAWDRLLPHSTGAVYLNFMGAEEQGADALVRSAFGANYDRLVDVKTKYDPTNMFRLNQNIKPRT